MALALFDLDHTLLSGDTERLWVDFLIARGVLDPALAARNEALAHDYQLGQAAPQDFCAFFAATLAGRSPAGWTPLRNDFMDEVVRPRIPDAARGLLLALPVITALLIVNLSFGVMTRAAPQLNIFSIGFPLTLVLGLFIFWVGLSDFLAHFQTLTSEALLQLRELARIR